MNFSQKGIAHIVFLFIAATGIIVYLVAAQLLPFKDKLFFSLYPKPAAHAASSTDNLYNLGVLVIRYFPLIADGQNIDIMVTGDVGNPYTAIQQRTIDITNNLQADLAKASRYLGYQDATAPASLTYQIVDTKEYTQAVPMLTDGTRRPNYNGIMTTHNICDYVDNKGVREVWLWAYQGPTYPGSTYPYLNISESKMAGPFGDISNSYRTNDMPICKNTYRVYTFNYGRGTSEAMESWGHQIEAEISAINSNLFRSIWQGPNYPQTLGVNGRCGSVHNPPNSTGEYNRNNPSPWKSDCLDWKPDSLGILTDISCANWGCQDISDSNNVSLNYMIWNWQNLPGRKNTKIYQSKQLRNFWDIHGDFDNVMANSKTLFASPSPTPSPMPTSAPTSRPDLIPTALSAPSTTRAGQPFSVTWTVKNQGNKDAAHTKTTSAWEDRVFLSSDQTYDSTDVYLGKFSQPGPLAAGSSYTASVNAPLSGKVSGNYYLILRVDNWNDVAESDNNNNQKVVPITVSSTSVGPSPTPATTSSKRVFVTSTAYNGNLGGLSGADAKCQERANAVNLGGNWKAWLSDSNTSAASRLTHNNGSYKLVDGIVIADNWADLTDGSLKNSINKTESNGGRSAAVWTGTTSSGNIGAGTCAGWISTNSTDTSVQGDTLSKTGTWTQDITQSCSGIARPLYCFEQ